MITASEFKSLIFDVVFDDDPASASFTASWTSHSGLPFTDIARAFGLTLPPEFPAQLLPPLTALMARYNTATGDLVLSVSLTRIDTPFTLIAGATRIASGTTAYALRLLAGTSIPITRFPLLAAATRPSANPCLTTLDVTTATHTIDAPHLTHLNHAIAQTATTTHQNLPPFLPTDPTGQLTQGTTTRIIYPSQKNPHAQHRHIPLPLPG